MKHDAENVITFPNKAEDLNGIFYFLSKRYWRNNTNTWNSFLFSQTIKEESIGNLLLPELQYKFSLQFLLFIVKLYVIGSSFLVGQKMVINWLGNCNRKFTRLHYGKELNLFLEN